MGRTRTGIYKILTNNTCFTGLINYWIKDGTLEIDTYDLYELRDFIENVYMKHNRKEKEAIATYIRFRNPLKEFTIEKAFEVRLNKVCKKGGEALFNKLKNMSKEEKEIFGKSLSISQIKGRENRYSDLTPEESKKKSYEDAIIVKGRNFAIELGIDPDTLTIKELSKLSGYRKKKNYQNLSEDERIKIQLKRKRNFLRNKNVRERLTNKFKNFEDLDVDKLTDKEVDYWFSINCSIAPRETNEVRGIWVKLEEYSNWELYNRIVWNLTGISAKEKYTKEELSHRGHKKELGHKNLDHLFSIFEAFKLNINPHIIASKSNIKLVDCEYNHKKSSRCDITLEELFKLYDKEIKEKESN